MYDIIIQVICLDMFKEMYISVSFCPENWVGDTDFIAISKR